MKGVSLYGALAVLTMLFLYGHSLDQAKLWTVAVVGWGQFAVYIGWRIFKEHFVIDDDELEDQE